MIWLFRSAYSYFVLFYIVFEVFYLIPSVKNIFHTKWKLLSICFYSQLKLNYAITGRFPSDNEHIILIENQFSYVKCSYHREIISVHFNKMFVAKLPNDPCKIFWWLHPVNHILITGEARPALHQPHISSICLEIAFRYRVK